MMAPWLVLMAVAGAQEAPAEDFRGYLDQARFFIKKRWYDDALAELELAVAHPDGRVDPEAWYLLATVRYELTDLEGARAAAERAHTYSRDDDQLQAAAGFAEFVREQFGVVEVRAPYAGLAARLDVQLDSVLFDPALKIYLEQLQTRYHRKHVLPQRLGLPVGTYLINGRQVVVDPNGQAVLELGSSELEVKGPAATKLARAEIGLGMSAWVGSRVRNLLPAPDLQVAVSQPVGPMRVAVVLDWVPRPYRLVDGGSDLHLAGWSLGGRVGVELPNTDPFLFRVSLGYRYSLVPGVEIGCASVGAGFSCGTDQGTDLMLYAVGRAHVPYAELSIDHLDPNRTMAVGLGVKGVVERAFGTLPASGEALALSDGEVLAFEVDEDARGWTATGFRAMVNLSLAF